MTSANANQETISFYIPRMSNKYCDAEWITMLLEIEQIGRVSSVEFQPITRGKKKVIDNYKKVVINMKMMFKTEIGNAIYENVILKNDKTFRFFPNKDEPEYWLFLNNKTVAVTKNLDTQTIAKQTKRLLELAEVIISQAEQIAKKNKEIEKLKSSVAALDNRVILSVNSGNLDKGIKPFTETQEYFNAIYANNASK